MVMTVPAQAAQPLFQMPFSCEEVWRASTYSGHNAIDWNLYPDDNGREVVASAAGTATLFEEPIGGYQVIIDHGNGWQTVYAHLQQNGRVSGQVTGGDLIGFVGSSGTGVTGAHLHWEQKYNGIRQSTLYANGVALNPGSNSDQSAPAYTSANCVVNVTQSRVAIITPGNNIYAKDDLASGGWYDQGATSSKVAVGGNRLALINGAGNVYAKDHLGVGGWLNQGAAAKKIAVGSTGRMLIITPDNWVYGKDNLGVGGWLNQNAQAVDIAVGGNRVAIINPCGAVYAKDNLGAGGWVQQTACGTAIDVQLSSSGRIAIINSGGLVYAKDNINGAGGWLDQVATATKLEIEGDRLMILTPDKQVYAKNHLGQGGWTNQQDQSATVNDIAMTSEGRLVLLNGANRVYAKDNIGVGGWLDQNATAITVVG